MQQHQKMGMNRRNFLRGFGLLVAAAAVAPAVKLLSEEDTICCGGGLIASIEASAQCFVYDPHITVAMFREMMVSSSKNQWRTW